MEQQPLANDEAQPGRLSLLLGRAHAGDPDAFQAVFSAAYPELRSLARARLRVHGPRFGEALDTTSLVHETFLRFASGSRLSPEHRPHFFRYASRVMRSVIVDGLRERSAQRRGGEYGHQTFTTELESSVVASEDVALKVHEALDALAEYDPRLVDVVQMRYFAGLTDLEIATALGVTERTIRRDWEKARLLLWEALEGG